MVSLGNNIKRIRLEKKLSRRELAELTGVSQGYLTQIEFDKRCKEYGIDLSELNDEDLDLLAGNIFVLAKKILKNKEDKAD